MKRKKKSVKRILKHKIFRFRNIFSILIIFLTVILITQLIKINILPAKYIALASSILLGINLLSICFINAHKKIVLKVLGTILIILSVAINCIGLYYSANTNKFINESFTSKSVFVKNTYYVLSKTENNLQEKDITGEISTYKETNNLAEALEKLNDKYVLKEKQYDDLGLLFDNINNSTDKFMLLEKSSYEIIFSIAENMNREDYTILYEFDVFTKRRAPETTNKEKFNIFIGGTDFAGLMDFNMIVSVNRNTHKVLLTSIPRDSYIEVAGKDGRYDKLSFINAYGPDANKESLEKFLDTEINYSVKIDTNSLVSVVDYLGGIEYCSDYEFTTTHALVLNTYRDTGKKLRVIKGCQKLDGIETLTVARERNAFPGRDRVRQKNCQQIMLAIFKKLIGTDTILHYNETLNTLGTLYETDMPKEIITDIIKEILNKGNIWQIETQSIDGTDTHNRVHLSNMIDWVMTPDPITVENAKTKLKEIMND